VSSFYQKISTPVLANLSLDFGDIQVEDTYPYPLPDLFAGSQVVLVGRYREGGVTEVTLRGTVNDREATYAFEGVRFQEEGGEDFIPRLWATRKIGHLLTQVRLHGADSELIDEIVELSVRYGIVTPYTSFLIDETEDALTSEGRHELAQRELFAYSGGGAAPVSGAQVVEESLAQKGLREADVAAQPQVEPVQVVGNKTFVLQNGTWIDTAYDAAKMTVHHIGFGGESYFALTQRYPEVGPYLALGTQIILVWEEQAYEIGTKDDGETRPQESQVAPTATRAPTVTEAPTVPSLTPTVIPSPTASPTPEPGIWQRIGDWLKGIFA
jgi:Ca-activated chloride channel family protein